MKKKTERSGKRGDETGMEKIRNTRTGLVRQ